jgi:hypothetical protein
VVKTSRTPDAENAQLLLFFAQFCRLFARFYAGLNQGSGVRGQGSGNRGQGTGIVDCGVATAAFGSRRHVILRTDSKSERELTRFLEVWP